MGKWLVAGGIAIVALVILLLLQMRPSTPAPVAHKLVPPHTQVATLDAASKANRRKPKV